MGIELLKQERHRSSKGARFCSCSWQRHRGCADRSGRSRILLRIDQIEDLVVSQNDDDVWPAVCSRGSIALVDGNKYDREEAANESADNESMCSRSSHASASPSVVDWFLARGSGVVTGPLDAAERRGGFELRSARTDSSDKLS